MRIRESIYNYILVAYLTLYSQTLFSQRSYYVDSERDGVLYVLNGKKREKLTKMQYGNTYFFKRGKIFHQKLDTYFPKDENTTKIIKIKAYGKGSVPIFSLYSELKSEDLLQIDGLWCVDLTKVNSLASNSDKFNIGFIKIDDKIIGGLKFDKNSLISDGEFCIENNLLFIKYSEEIKEKKVKIAYRINGIDLNNNIDIEDIVIEGAGGHGIQGVKKHSVHINRVYIREIGGSILPRFGSGSVRFGNGIEFWTGGINCTVENCMIEDVYDAALTIQGDANNMLFENIVFRNNKLKNNEQAFEFWTRGKNIIIRNCKFERNICKNSGLGWSHNVRPDKNVGFHILNYELNAVERSIWIKNNHFYKSNNGLIALFNYENDLRFFAKKNIIHDTSFPYNKIDSKKIQINSSSIQFKTLHDGFKLVK